MAVITDTFQPIKCDRCNQLIAPNTGMSYLIRNYDTARSKIRFPATYEYRHYCDTCMRRYS